MATSTKTFRFAADLLAALEAWRDKTETAEGARPSLQAAVIRLLWQALREGKMEKLSHAAVVDELRSLAAAVRGDSRR